MYQQGTLPSTVALVSQLPKMYSPLNTLDWELLACMLAPGANGSQIPRDLSRPEMNDIMYPGQDFSIINDDNKPGLFEKPGFIVIIGVEKSTVDPSFDVLEEVESGNINDLLTSCLHLREKYGFGKGADLFNVWCGETDRFDSLLNDVARNTSFAFLKYYTDIIFWNSGLGQEICGFIKELLG